MQRIRIFLAALGEREIGEMREMSMKKAIRLACMAMVAWYAISAWAQEGEVANKADAGNKGDVAAAKPPGANSSDYVLGSDDQLHITVWNETNLTESVPVRPDGKISLPLINDIQAAGLTPMELRDSITEKLKKYFADPRVTVVVTAMNSRRIFVTGEVTHTGAIPLLPNMTMLQALATAGFTQFANLKGIYVLRMENGRQVKLPFNYREVIKGNHPEQNIFLKPGDTVVVP
jgi:polysaccharide biosynthesis/export protein